MTINCKGNLIDLSTPKVMGILNLTPDSFYDGGKYSDEHKILNQVERMLEDGASFIDVGGYSSRPNSEHISEEEELKRVVQAIEPITKEFPETIISVDTFRSKVAHHSLESGAAMVNDISAGSLDKQIMDVVAQFQVPYIMMHLKGTPQNMTSKTNYENILKDILLYFSKKVNLARTKKIHDIIIDPGFGFSKTVAQNFHILNNLQFLKTLELPILAGVSRKSMIYKTLKNTPEEALNGTTSLNTVSLLKGANILRVHDVKEAVECIQLFEQLTV